MSTETSIVCVEAPRIEAVPYRDRPVHTVMVDGKLWIVFRRLCEIADIGYSTQLQKLKTAPWAAGRIVSRSVVNLAGDRRQNMVTIPYDLCIEWLDRLDVTLFDVHKRERIQQLKDEFRSAVAHLYAVNTLNNSLPNTLNNSLPNTALSTQDLQAIPKSSNDNMLASVQGWLAPIMQRMDANTAAINRMVDGVLVLCEASDKRSEAALARAELIAGDMATARRQQEQIWKMVNEDHARLCNVELAQQVADNKAEQHYKRKDEPRIVAATANEPKPTLNMTPVCGTPTTMMPLHDFCDKYGVILRDEEKKPLGSTLVELYRRNNIPMARIRRKIHGQWLPFRTYPEWALLITLEHRIPNANKPPYLTTCQTSA